MKKRKINRIKQSDFKTVKIDAKTWIQVDKNITDEEAVERYFNRLTNNNPIK